MQRIYKIASITLFSIILANPVFGFNLGDIGSFGRAVDAGSRVMASYEDLTPEQEYYLGRAVVARLLSVYPELASQAQIDYLNRMVDYLAWHSSRAETFGGYHAVIFESDIANAYSAPGGYILISSALMSQLNSEDELAAVVAHEIAHVALKHGMASINKSNLSQAAGLLGQEALSQTSDVAAQQLDLLTASFGSSINDIVTTVTTAGYSRSQELEADQEAARILYRAGYNPVALTSIINSQKENNPEQSGNLTSSITVTHPNDDKRLTEITRFISDEKLDSQPNPARNGRFNQIVKSE